MSAVKKPAKIASKNNPSQRKKGNTFKTYCGKDVKPAKYVNDENRESYMCAVFTQDNQMAFDAFKNPVRWDSI